MPSSLTSTYFRKEIRQTKQGDFADIVIYKSTYVIEKFNDLLVKYIIRYNVTN